MIQQNGYSPRYFNGASGSQISENEIDQMIAKLLPRRESNSLRREVCHFLTKVINKFDYECKLIICGSTGACTYLPDGDLDVVLVSSQPLDAQREQQILKKLLTTICDEMYSSDANFNPGDGNCGFSFRNVEFVNARTRLLNCTINNLSVDITMNQIGALASVLLLDEVDRLIGQDHLFKRSILLVKASNSSLLSSSTLHFALEKLLYLTNLLCTIYSVIVLFVTR